MGKCLSGPDYGEQDFFAMRQFPDPFRVDRQCDHDLCAHLLGEICQAALHRSLCGLYGVVVAELLQCHADLCDTALRDLADQLSGALSGADPADGLHI